MNPYPHHGITLDVCPGCRGLWFDPGELQRLVGDLLDFYSLDEIRDCKRMIEACPGCGEELKEKAIVAGGSLRIDSCPSCSGAFLDSGELERIRRVAAKRHGFVREQDAQLLAEIKDKRRKRRDAAKANRSTVEIETAYTSRRHFIAFLLGIPLEEDPNAESSPFAVLVLMALLIIVWGWQITTGLDESVALWGLVPDLIREGHAHASLLFSNFLHGGWFHLGVNLYVLWVFGDNVEHRMGSVLFFFFFILWGLAGSALTVAYTTGLASSLPHVGASGAIAGAMGAYAVLFPRNRFVVPLFGFFVFGWLLRVPVWLFVGFWAIVQALSGWLQLPAIAWWDHLGGLLAGAVVGFLYRIKDSN